MTHRGRKGSNFGEGRKHWGNVEVFDGVEVRGLGEVLCV